MCRIARSEGCIEEQPCIMLNTGPFVKNFAKKEF